MASRPPLLDRPLHDRADNWCRGLVTALGIALVVYGAAITWRLTEPDPAPVVAAPAPIVQTVVYVWTPTPTRTAIATATARIVVVTPTASPTPVVPPCSQAAEGEVCVRFAEPPTPAPIPPCSRITPSAYQTQTCRRDDAGTGSKEETQ